MSTAKINLAGGNHSNVVSTGTGEEPVKITTVDITVPTGVGKFSAIIGENFTGEFLDIIPTVWAFNGEKLPSDIRTIGVLDFDFVWGNGCVHKTTIPLFYKLSTAKINLAGSNPSGVCITFMTHGEFRIPAELIPLTSMTSQSQKLNLRISLGLIKPIRSVN